MVDKTTDGQGGTEAAVASTASAPAEHEVRTAIKRLAHGTPIYNRVRDALYRDPFSNPKKKRN